MWHNKLWEATANWGSGKREIPKETKPGCVWIRIGRELKQANIAESVARIQTKTKPGNEITSFCEERCTSWQDNGQEYGTARTQEAFLIKEKDTRST